MPCGERLDDGKMKAKQQRNLFWLENTHLGFLWPHKRLYGDIQTLQQQFSSSLVLLCQSSIDLVYMIPLFVRESHFQ